MSFLTKRIHFQHIINNITSFVVLSTQTYVLLSFLKKKKKKSVSCNEWYLNSCYFPYN